MQADFSRSPHWVAANVRPGAAHLLLCVLAIGSGTTCDQAPTFDVIIRGGIIYDGSGQPGLLADVAITADSIVAIGQLEDARGLQEINADGLAVAPGFINMLSAAPEALLYDGRSLSNLYQGVTLEVYGEGDSWGPVNEDLRQWMLRDQVGYEYPITWKTLDEALETLVKRGVSTNVASFLGATTARRYVMGEANRAPTPVELDSMRALVRRAMEEGALGIGASLIYAPAAFARTEELIELAKVAAEYRGRYIAHMRSEGNQLLEALEETIRIGRQARIPVEIWHLKAAGMSNFAKMDTVINRIEAARSDGQAITANMYPYTHGATGLNASMPLWVQEGGIDAWRGRLRDPAIRARVLREMKDPQASWENLYLAAGGADSVWLTDFAEDSLKYLTGMNLAAVSRLYGRSPEETMMELVIRDGSRVGARYALMSVANVRKQLALPWVSIGSDAMTEAPEGLFLEFKQHPRAYGAFARVLGHYVREERLLSLEEALRRISGFPAANLGISRRGMLRPGYFADVVVFDPIRIADHATYEAPQRFATGVMHVLVNGVSVIRDGQYTGLRPGRVVHGPGYRP